VGGGGEIQKEERSCVGGGGGRVENALVFGTHSTYDTGPDGVFDPPSMSWYEGARCLAGFASSRRGVSYFWSDLSLLNKALGLTAGFRTKGLWRVSLTLSSRGVTIASLSLKYTSRHTVFLAPNPDRL